MKEEGWQVYGGTKSIKEALDQHYSTLAAGQGRLTPMESNGRGRDVNIALRRCQTAAAQQYATMRGSNVEGQTSLHVTNEENSSASTNIKMDTHVRTSTSQKVKSLLPTVVFYRTLPDGQVEVRSLYLIDTTTE